MSYRGARFFWVYAAIRIVWADIVYYVLTFTEVSLGFWSSQYKAAMQEIHHSNKYPKHAKFKELHLSLWWEKQKSQLRRSQVSWKTKEQPVMAVGVI